MHRERFAKEGNITRRVGLSRGGAGSGCRIDAAKSERLATRAPRTRRRGYISLLLKVSG